MKPKVPRKGKHATMAKGVREAVKNPATKKALKGSGLYTSATKKTTAGKKGIGVRAMMAGAKYNKKGKS